MMSKRSKIAASDGEFQLPQPMIQHIQSFLTTKEAARTTVLSKSWYGAWLTRPDLDFDQRHFQRLRDLRLVESDDGFSEFADKTLQRYDQLNLKINTFRLQINDGDRNPNHTQWIAKAIRLGATDVEISDNCRDSTLGTILPKEVLGSESLVSLSAEGCRIDLGADGEVKCSSLKCLSFERMYFERDIVCDIISICPLLEELTLSDCEYGLEEPTFDVFTQEECESLPSSPFSDFSKQKVGSGLETPYVFGKLEYLMLEKVFIDTSFFSNFSSKFPCLTELYVCDCNGYEELEISSASLECISFVQVNVLEAKFDVPRIDEFSIRSHFLPVVSFEKPLNKFVSHINLSCDQPETSWFVKLRKFLTKLSMSKISLSICFGGFLAGPYDWPTDVEGLRKPLVENLKILVGTISLAPNMGCYDLDALICSCRPKFMTQHWCPKAPYTRAKWKLLGLLGKILVEKDSENRDIFSRYIRSWDYLKEVNLRIYDESVAKWVPLPWGTILDPNAYPEKEKLIRFQFKWK